MHKEVLNEKAKELLTFLSGFKDFYLAGGTALALQLGHRISIDFDLFSDKPIAENLLSVIENKLSGKQILPSVNNINELTLFIDGIKTTFLYYPFSLLFPLIDFEGIKLASPREIALTKAYTIGRRGSLKDYVDLYFILVEKIDSLSGIIENAEKKYKDVFNARLFLEQLVYFKDIKDTDIQFLKNKISVAVLEKFFQDRIKEIKF